MTVGLAFDPGGLMNTYAALPHGRISNFQSAYSAVASDLP